MQKLFLSTALATVLALGGAALAQQSSPSGPSTAPSTTAPSGSPTGAMAGPASGMRASDIIGTDVKNPQGETVGEIEELLVQNDGRVTHVVISVGGFLGMGDRRVAVPFNEMQVQADGRQITYNITKDQLKQQPEYRPERSGEPARSDQPGQQRQPGQPGQPRQ